MVDEFKKENFQIITEFELIQSPMREDGFPKIKEIVKGYPFVSIRKDPNYELPYSALEKEY